MCSETRAEYYDVLSDHRQSLKVAVLLYISVISGSWPLVMGFLNLQATNTKYLTCTTITLKGLQK